MKCPYCFRELGVFKHDPILRPDGCPVIWIDDTTLGSVSEVEQRIYKGLTQITKDDIIELQEALRTLELENLTSNFTIFSEVNNTGEFQITGKHILEMRQSIEKLLTQFSMTKTQFFNYDELGNHIIRVGGDKTDWTDPITEETDLNKFQIRFIHIEDIRHAIETFTTMWFEDWLQNGSFPLINDSETWVWDGSPAFGKVFAMGQLKGENNWFRSGQVWGGNIDQGYVSINCSYTFIQNGLGSISLGASAQAVKLLQAGSLNDVGVVFNHELDLSDILAIQTSGKMKVKFDSASASGSGGYHVIIEMDASINRKTLIGIVGGNKQYSDEMVYETLVFANAGGTFRHAEGVPWHYIQESNGHLVSDPADGGAPYYSLSAWESIHSGIIKLVDVHNKEYGFSDKSTEPENIGESYLDFIRVTAVRVYTYCGGSYQRYGKDYEGQTITAAGSVNFSIGKISLGY